MNEMILKQWSEGIITTEQLQLLKDNADEATIQEIAEILESTRAFRVPEGKDRAAIWNTIEAENETEEPVSKPKVVQMKPGIWQMGIAATVLAAVGVFVSFFFKQR